MIIGKNKLIEAAVFVKSLEKALSVVCRITESTSSSICTGWLLTNRLALIPGFVATQNMGSAFYCYPHSKQNKSGQPIAAELVFTTGQGSESIALLRLETSIKKDFDDLLLLNGAEVDDMIFIPQYPGGHPSTHLSFGKIIDLAGITYDADTGPGASGAPVFHTLTGKIIAMHMQSLRGESLNHGISVEKILEPLRDSEFWNEIIRYHGIVDISSINIGDYKQSAKQEWKDIHLQTALSWTFNKEKLSEKEREEVQPYVIDPGSEQWALKPSDRQTILRSQSISKLRRIKVTHSSNTQGQKVISRILKGGPYDLEKIAEDELPYWLQAVRWFTPLDEKLPSPGDVNRVLERKRIRSRLANLGGADFHGRAAELKELSNWYKSNNNSPVMISGIGGIGKSALISHFALSLPHETPLLWLDFDRADIAPDDAKSVLKNLADQLSIQIKNFQVRAGIDKWEDMAEKLGEEILATIGKSVPPLLVLDSFEVAQHIKQYAQIWELLMIIIGKYPKLKIIVSGRAQVPSLSLQGNKALPIELEGMEPNDAKNLLAQHNIKNKPVVDKVIDISRGIPLILKLAVHYIESGGKLDELPESLPKTLIEGFLYQRILDRIMDPKLKPISKKALILRKITIDIIKTILHDTIPDGMSPDQAFEGLSREMGLILESEIYGPTGVTFSVANTLQLRPELRSAAIKLLESENEFLITEVDKKAIDYYLKQDLDKPEYRAELIYHLLRVGNLSEAKKYWAVECAPLLKYAAEDISEIATAERNWLQQQIGRVIGETKDDIRIWELEALRQIRNGLERTHYDGVGEILKQRTQRSDNSPLIVYDAWNLWRQNDIVAAIALLENQQPLTPSFLRNQYVLHAFLESQQGNNPKADFLLALIQQKDWDDRPNSTIEKMAWTAARIRLTVDLNSEFRITEWIVNGGYTQPGLLIARYSTTPALVNAISDKWVFEGTYSEVKLPVTEVQLDSFKTQLLLQLPFYPNVNTNTDDLQELYAENFNAYDAILSESPSADNRSTFEAIAKLILEGTFRWKHALTTMLLADFANLASEKEEQIDPIDLSIIATLAAFRGQKMTIMIGGYDKPSIDEFLSAVIKNNPRSVPSPLSDLRKSLLDKYFTNEEKNIASNSNTEVQQIRQSIDAEMARQNDIGNTYNSFKFLNTIKDAEMLAMTLYLAGPDPLEMLCRRLIGLPDSYKF